MDDLLFPDEFFFDGNIASLAHCKICHDPMYCIYMWGLRDHCHECMEEIAMENARRILGTK